MRASHAYILRPKEGGGYAYIFDSLEKAQRKNKVMHNRLQIIKVRLTPVGYEKNTIETKE